MRKTTTSIDLWIDGVQVNTTSYTGTFKGATSGRIQLWWFPLDTSVTWKGDAADLRFYSEALTDAEIKKLYADVKPSSSPLIFSSANSGGSISPSGTTAVTPGKSQKFTITADTGYKIGQIRVDNTDIAITNNSVQEYTLSNVTTNHSITAFFTVDIGTKNATLLLKFLPGNF